MKLKRTLALLLLAIANAALAQTVTTEQYAEDGARTTPVSVSGSGPAAPAEQTVCAGGVWMRLRFSALVLEGADALELTGSAGGRLVFQGNNWADRSFFTRAFGGDCVTVRPTFAQANSRFTIDAHQSGTTALAATPMISAGAGDICDSGLACRATGVLIEDMVPAPHVVFTLGDNQYESGLLSEYNRDYERTWGRFKNRTRPASGNHEYSSGNAGAGYFDYFNGVGQASGPAGQRGQGYYSYDLGDWHIVVLNTSNSGAVAYGAGSAQEQWLRRDLAANTKPCTMAQMHHPLFSRGNYRPGIAGTRALWQALYDYRADIVLAGHDHNYQRFAPQTPAGAASADGVRLFVVGTGGRSSYAFTGSQANFETGHDNIDGVLKLTLSSGAFAWQFVSVPGSPAFSDSGSGRCHNAPRLDVSVSPASVTLPRGQSTTATVSVTNPSGEAVTLSLTGLPSGVSGSFAPNPVTPAAGSTATSTLTLSAAASAATGTVSVTVTGTAGTATDTATLALSVPDTAAPAAPTGLSASAGNAQVALQWAANTEADLRSYRVKRATNAGGPYTVIATVNAPTRAYTNTGLTNGTTYHYIVTALDASGNESGPSNAVSATPRDLVAPAVPSGLAASAGNTLIALDWANNAEPDLASYRVKRAPSAGGPYSTIATVSAPTSAYTDTGLTNGTAYHYVVSAVDFTGNESANSAAVSATPTSEIVLASSTASGDKIDVKRGQTGAQSFIRLSGGPYYIARVVLGVSRESSAPNANLEISIGGARNTGAMSETVAITPAMVTNRSGGASFQALTVQFATPVGPLLPGTTYYLNFVNNASNGKAYFLRYSSNNAYRDGAYYKGTSNTGKDIRFQLLGSAEPATPGLEMLLVESTAAGSRIDVKRGQTGAQSFKRIGGSTYRVSRVVLGVSRDSVAPDGSLEFSIGTARNGSALTGTSVAITPAMVTNGSAGASFQTLTLNFPTPVALTPGVTYYLNFATNAPNGKAYFLQYGVSGVYSGGSYYKGSSNQNKDIRFQLWGTAP